MVQIEEIKMPIPKDDYITIEYLFSRYIMRSEFFHFKEYDMKLKLALLSMFMFVYHFTYATSITKIPLSVNRIISHPNKEILYASVPSKAAAPYGNTLVIINAKKGKYQASEYIGSEPGPLAISNNGKYVYVGLDGSGSFTRYNTQTHKKELTFYLGSDPFVGKYYVEEMAVFPDAPESVAISRKNKGYSPRHEGVVIFDNDKMRPKTSPGHTGANIIAFDGHSSEYLYGLNNETTEFGFRTFEVSSEGLTKKSVFTAPTGFGTKFIISGGFAYTTNGQKFDIKNGNLAGRFNASGSVAVDENAKKAYFIADGEIAIFNTETFVQIDAIAIDTNSGHNIVRYGKHGLAYCTHDAVYLVTSPLIG